MWTRKVNGWSWMRGFVVLAISIALALPTASAQLSSEADKQREVDALYDQVSMLYEGENYDSALPIAKRLLSIVDTLRAPYQPRVAFALNKVAMLYHRKGDYPLAESLYKRSLEVWEWYYLLTSLRDNNRQNDRALSPSPPEAAPVLANLAALYKEEGDYTRAEEFYQKGIKSIEDVLGPDHLEAVTILNDLAVLYKEEGDYTRAEEFYGKSLKIIGLNNPDAAPVLASLAALYQQEGDYARAEEFYKKSLKIIGANQLDAAPVLNDLAGLYQEKGEYTRAEKSYRKSLKIFENTLGPNHTDVTIVLTNLATLYRDKGDYTRAEECCRRSLKIKEKALGPKHPEVATAVQDLAAMCLARGKIKESVKLLTRASDIDEFNMGRILLTGSEDQKKLYMNTLMYRTDFNISFHIEYASSNPAAVKLAINSILRRKGRVLEAMHNNYAALSRRLSNEDRKTLEELRSTTGELANLAMKGPGKGGLEPYEKEFNRLQRTRDRLEQTMNKLSAEVRASTQPVTLEAVQQSIPKGTALVEIARYMTYDVKTGIWEKARYMAYVLWSDRAPLWADLGEAEPIDEEVPRLRGALANRESTDVAALARALDERTMRPIRQLLGDTRTVLLSPDGPLNLIPFGALVDEKERYLVEEYSFTYLTSGRDLLRMQIATDSKTLPVIIANPNYILYGFDPSKQFWPPLPWSADEAEALKELLQLPESRVWERDKATEEVLKKVSAPQILHVSTHGFFKDRVPEPETAGKPVKLELNPSRGPVPPLIDYPLLRSGLVLAGANSQSKWYREDGVITALEIADLDLWGTKLVVLSACETGVGEVQTGEGVYGLRRSLVLAGSESQVMSLWKVSDKGTQQLMVAYYENLKAGQGRTEALREAQRAMLGSKDRSHPYYWASFIASGDWRPIDWKTRVQTQLRRESATAQVSDAAETVTTPPPDKGNPTGEKVEKPSKSKGASSGLIFGKVIKVIIDEDLIVVERDHKKGVDAYEIKDARWTGQYKDQKDVYVGDLVAVQYVVRNGKKIAKEVMALSRTGR